MDKVEVTQLGPINQVVGLYEGTDQDGLTCFDIICATDGDLVQYLRRPYGKLNVIPVDDRGWVHLERFITILKAAMIEDDSFDTCIFCNSEMTRDS